MRMTEKIGANTRPEGSRDCLKARGLRGAPSTGLPVQGPPHPAGVHTTGKGAGPLEKTRVWPRAQGSRSATPLLPAIPPRPNAKDLSKTTPGGEQTSAGELSELPKTPEARSRPHRAPFLDPEGRVGA